MTSMLRPLASSILLLGFLLPSAAQRSGIGIKAGLGGARVGSGAYSTRLAPAGTFGLYVPLLASPRFELQPELLISALGALHTTREGAEHTVHQYYLQVPLVAKIFVSNCVALHGGVQASKLLAADLATQDGSRSVTSEYQRDEIALVMGAGLDLRSGVDITIRYHNGMTPVLVNDEQLLPRNRALFLSVGYRLLAFKGAGTQRRRR
jgi:hypothetical protein